MANLGKWTAAARDAESNSVVLAIPVQSIEGSSGPTDYWIDPGAGGMAEVIFLGGAVGLFALSTSFRRLKNRRGRLGKRSSNDRVAILFYPDRVDLHDRLPVLKRVGKHLESHPMSEVTRTNATTITVADIDWNHSLLAKNELERKLGDHGIELPT